MLGRVADAEDVVQDVWVRWQEADRARVRDRVAFLVTITTRVALNVATSARARREVSVGGRPPERDYTSADPAIGAEREALELAVQLLIERLAPVERAVYVLREAFGYPFRDIAEALELLLLAWRGADAQASALIQANVGDATTWGEGRAIGLGDYLLAVLYNGFGRYHAALASAERACEHDDLGAFGFALVELVDAGARGDAPEVAATALRRLEERTTASGTDWALGILARSGALLSDGRAADLLYREAIERLERNRIAVHLARTHLVYGEWLRRENRRTDAREQLRTAYDMLDRFGAGAFAERARRELLATGESVHRRTVEAQTLLTAQEAQIARLASEGMTNSHIGAELFISPRTVEWHLGKVFTKLDVDSRNKLREALAST